LYYGRYARTPQGDLIARAGLKDCLSVYSSGGPLDVNTVEPETMLAVGAPPPAVEAVLSMRRAGPIRQEQMALLAPLMGPSAGRFRVGGDSIYTLRATGRPRRQDGVVSDVRRSAKLTAVFNPRQYAEGLSILRRNDDAAGERMVVDPWPR